MYNNGEVRAGPTRNSSHQVSIQLMIVDGNRHLLEVMSCSLKSRAGLEVVATASRAHELLETLSTIELDVLILHLNTPDMDGLTLLETIKERYPDLPVITLSLHDEQRTQALRRGAHSFWTQDQPLHDLYLSILRAHQS